MTNWVGRDGRPVPNGPWRRQTGLVADEDDHGVVLTNDARDSLILTADDVAAIANAIGEIGEQRDRLIGRLDQIQMVIAGANGDDFKLDRAMNLSRYALTEIGQEPT